VLTQKKVRVPDLVSMKQRGERIVMLTVYDATLARLLDRAGIDLLLVGNSLKCGSRLGYNDSSDSGGNDLSHTRGAAAPRQAIETGSS